MIATSAPAILILTPDSRLRQQWVDSLESASCRVFTEAADIPPAVDLDVILTNQSVLHAVLETQSQQLQDGKVGVVAIGGGGPADIALPSDATQRELRMACRMLGEIIQLRRRVRRGARLQRALSQLALTDPLTKLPNRRAWDQELRRHAQHAGRQSACCLAVLDLDRFDEVNERLGHPAGDEVLREVGQTVRRTLSKTDFVARLGGDEFGLLLFRPDESNAVEAIERVRSRLAQRMVDAVPQGLTATAGYAYHAPGSVFNANAMFLAADEALRSAKRSGRDRTAAMPAD